MEKEEKQGKGLATIFYDSFSLHFLLIVLMTIFQENLMAFFSMWLQIVDKFFVGCTCRN
jgi:hypothetical protein